MNKQDLSAQTKVPVNSIDSIFSAMGLPKDLPDYTDEHVNLIQVVRDLHKNEGCKSWAEAVGLYRKPINEAQLKEIAARYSMSDRTPEITSALKLKLESMTAEQFEQFRVVCEQVQQGMDLGIVAQGVLNKAKAQPSVPVDGAALAQRKESKLTTDRPMPELVEQSAAKIEHTPLKGEASDLWGKIADIGAAVDAETLATSPFDGIKKASERIRAEANALEQHGEQIYFEKFGKAFNDPALLKKVAEQNLGKFPPEWDLSSKIQL
jgi:hypothetical protein